MEKKNHFHSWFFFFASNLKKNRSGCFTFKQFIERRYTSTNCLFQFHLPIFTCELWIYACEIESTPTDLRINVKNCMVRNAYKNSSYVYYNNHNRELYLNCTLLQIKFFIYSHVSIFFEIDAFGIVWSFVYLNFIARFIGKCKLTCVLSTHANKWSSIFLAVCIADQFFEALAVAPFWLRACANARDVVAWIFICLQTFDMNHAHW